VRDIVRSLAVPGSVEDVFATALMAGDRCGFEVDRSDPAVGTIRFVTRFSWLAFGNDRVDVNVSRSESGGTVVMIVGRRIHYATWLAQRFVVARAVNRYADVLGGLLQPR
jgi:hypothetical protein